MRDLLEEEMINSMVSAIQQYIEFHVSFSQDILSVEYDDKQKNLIVSYYNKTDERDKEISDIIGRIKNEFKIKE